MKPTVYLETTIPSYLASRVSNDLRVAANQNSTQEWWEIHRQQFDLFVSEFVLAEASLGDSEVSARRLSFIADLPKLEINEDVRILAHSLINQGPIPRNAEIDAFHIAVAAVNGIEYLLTWNCTHIANAVMRSKIEQVCRQNGYEPPIICTPQELREG